MPTVARDGPFRVFFYSNEGAEPPHVHVSAGRATAKVWLRQVAIARSRHFSPRELRQIEALVTDNADAFLEAWNDHFNSGTDPNGE